ncbi:MAG TPA: hypothetical protein VGI43_05935 [Mucilaginibacter sp.]|jgi:hypothetical protein
MSKILTKIILVFIILNFFLTNGYAQALDTGSWNNFEGKIGKNDCSLSLYLFKDRSIKGNYAFKIGGNKILLQGYLKANAIFLTELKPGNSVFKGNLFTDTLDKFEGTRIDGLKKEVLLFHFKLSSIEWGEYGHRYTDMFGTDDEIETFMQTVKTAILSDNKNWLADHIHYPTRHILRKGYTSINNKLQLIKYYEQIFTAKFKEKIKSDYTTNLFCKGGEVMLGDGEIWISNTPNSIEHKYDFIINAINPPN